MPALRPRLLLCLAALPVALCRCGCSDRIQQGGPFPIGLVLSDTFPSVNDRGGTTTVFATATMSDETVAVGSVAISASAGTLNGSHNPVTQVLDGTGTVRATFACDRSQDSACQGSVQISAVWGSIHAVPLTLLITASGSNDAGPGPDAGTAADSGTPADGGSPPDAGVDAGPGDSGTVVFFDAGPSHAVAYQIDVAHTGNQTADTLTPPLTQRWASDLGGLTSYPLIVDGLVLVTVRNTTGYGTKLHALDLQTGAQRWGPVDLGGTYFWSGLCYDNGAVFTVNYDGLVQAFDLLTGAQRWLKQMPGQYAFSSPPTAANGTLYVGGAGSGGTVYAVDETNGNVRWTASVMNGDNSSPAIAGNSVFVSYACDQTYAFDPGSGALQWHHSGTCEGGGGRTPTLAGDRLYVRDWATSNIVLDTASGSPLGTFSAGPIPAFADAGVGYFLSGSTLSAEALATASTMWTFTGDGTLVTAPIVVNGFIYMGSSNGKLFAVEPAGGTAVWSVGLDGGINGPDEQNVSQPLTGLAAAQNTLVVPVGSVLYAFQ